MLKKQTTGAVIGGILLLVSSLTSVGASDLESGSSAFIKSLAEKAIGSLASRDTERDERIRRFRDMFKENFAVRSIGKFVLGRNFRKASKDELKEYYTLFEDLMVVSYVDRFATYAGEALTVEKTRTESESTATVFSRIERPGGAKAIRVNWRVGTNGKIYKILDVVVEGTSMSQTLRSDFSSIVRSKGGKIAGLLEQLRLKTASLKSE